MAEYDIYDSNGHFHSGPYASKQAASKHALALTESESGLRIGEGSGSVGEAPDELEALLDAKTYEVRKVGAPAIAVETTEVFLEEDPS